MGRGDGRWERRGGRYLQLGAALLQGFHRQLERSAVAVDAGAHLQDLELGATAALQRWKRTQAQWPGSPWLSIWLCSCPSPTYQQCTQDGSCLGTAGQPQLAHSRSCLLQEVHHGCGLHLGTQHMGACHFGPDFFRTPGDTELTMECCMSRLWSSGQALASMTRVSGLTPWQSESLRKVSREQDSPTSYGRQSTSRDWGSVVHKREKPVADTKPSPRPQLGPPFCPWQANMGTPTSDTSLLKETTGKENQAGVPMGQHGAPGA